MNPKNDSPESLSPRVLRQAPLQILLRVALVVIAALVLGVVLPWVVAYSSGTFRNTDVVARLPAAAKAEWEEFQRVDEQRRTAIRQVEDHLYEAAQKQDPSAEHLIQLHEHLTKLRKEEPPIAVTVYYLDDIMPLWPVFYASIGTIVFVLSPRSIRVRLVLRKALRILPFLFLFQRWPTWVRNSSLGQLGRRVYSSANLDINKAEFFTQEFMALLVCCLLAVCWAQWLSFYDTRLSDLSKRSPDHVADALDNRRLRQLQDTFLQWQVVSVALCLGFSYYSYFFWHRVAHNHDVRFIAPALIVHLLWLLTWLIVSAPLFITWQDWSEQRLRAMTALALTPKVDDAEKKFETLEKLQPVSFWNLSGSTLIAIGSFAFPLLQGIK